MIRVLCLFLLSAMFIACTGNKTKEPKDQVKIITAGGTITEIVHALGFGEDIIATDITSTYPREMQELPSIGYRNQIKAEGILALGPDLVLAEDGYMSVDVVQQLEAAGLQILFFEKPKDINGTYRIVSEIAGFLEVLHKGDSINASIKEDIIALGNYLEHHSTKPSMAFVMARGQEMLFLAGEDTFAESLFNMAGINHLGKGFKDFIPLTPEIMVSMNPDFLLFFDSGLLSIGEMDGIKNISGITHTTAFRQQQIIALDGQYLSGFGPRVGKAAMELAKAVRK